MLMLEEGFIPLCKVNYVISTVADGFNVCNNLSEESRIDVRNEINLAQDMEDNKLLEESLLSNKALCGGETAFDTFFDKMKEELNKEIADHACRHDDKKCSCRWMSTPQMANDVSIMLPQDVPTPSVQMIG